MARHICRVIFCFLFIVTVATGNALGIEIYLSPNGKDSNNGSKQHPLLTLTAARDKIRQLRKNGDIRETIYVIVEKGSYYMSQPLELSNEDSGTPQSPVVFKAADGASPIFYGGVEIKG